jgi:acetolactate synthase-1/2/3 large subunit
MKAAELVTDTLAELGVRYLAGVIGSSIEDIVETVPAQRTLRYLSVRHEQVASALCDGYAKVSGKPMACIAHAGPGACNLLTGVASAFRDSTPMMVLTGNLGSSRLGRDAWHELDVEAIYRPVTKWTARIRRPAEIESVLLRAYHCDRRKTGAGAGHIPQDMSAAQLPKLASNRR